VLLAVTLGAGGLAAVIPLAVLAGILVHIGIEIIDWNFLRRAPLISPRATALMWLVLLLTVFWDLVTAVVIGVFLANVLTIKGQAEALARTSRRLEGGADHADDLDPTERRLLERAGSRVMLLGLSGPLSFGASRYLTQLLSSTGGYDTLILDLTAVTHLGVTASLAIDALCRDAAQQQRKVLIAVRVPRQRQRLERLGLDRHAGVGFRDSRLEALEALAPATP
jgi:SulP family sulfate permease